MNRKFEQRVSEKSREGRTKQDKTRQDKTRRMKERGEGGEGALDTDFSMEEQKKI